MGNRCNHSRSARRSYLSAPRWLLRGWCRNLVRDPIRGSVFAAKAAPAQEGIMRARPDGNLTTRRRFLRSGATLAGAAVLSAEHAGAAEAPLRLAQTAAAASSGITVKSTRLVGSAINFAYAVKAGPWVFLNGHEAFDFERGLAPEVEGSP